MAPRFVRATVRAMDGYTPGEQPPAGARVVKLNTNENPFPPSPRVLQAIGEIGPESLRRYPGPRADAFRTVAARVHGVSRDMIIAGNGSDDILTIATRTFIPPRGLLAYPDPTYSLYEVLGNLQDARTVKVPWESGWSLPIDGLLASGADAIYLANPNAPSGTFVEPAKIAELAREFSGLLLIDEAYAAFARDHCLKLASEFPNVLVSRTFSKAYSLAGLRFGYAIGPADVIAEMMKVKDSYNCDTIAIAAASAALEDQDYSRRVWAEVIGERTRLTEELHALGWSVAPSEANFVWAAVPGGRAKEAYLGLKEQGILVRYFDQPGLTDHVRITVGTSQETNALLGGIKALSLADKAA